MVSTTAKPRARATFMSDLVVEHAEEIAFLWGQRRASLRSPELTQHNVIELDERIAAHLQGLLVPGESAAALLAERLAADDPLDAFAGALGLARLGSGPGPLFAALGAAEGERLELLTEALLHGGSVGLAAAL